LDVVLAQTENLRRVRERSQEAHSVDRRPRSIVCRSARLVERIRPERDQRLEPPPPQALRHPDGISVLAEHQPQGTGKRTREGQPHGYSLYIISEPLAAQESQSAIPRPITHSRSADDRNGSSSRNIVTSCR